jgi:O-antigen/teichoic acid export membrane protein
MSWMAVQTLGTRVLSLSGQLVLGWLLSPADFGLYALALSISNAVGALRNGGTAQMLVRHTEDFSDHARSLGGFAFIFNLLTTALLGLIAPWAAAHFHSRQLLGLLLCIAASFPLGTIAVIYRSRLTIDVRYRDLAALTFASTLFWQVATISMALAGCGPYSYVIPTMLQGPFETAFGFVLYRQWPTIQLRSSSENFLSIFRSSRWVMLGAAMLSLATSGDYMAVGLFTDAAMVGQYFFAFQLVSAVGTVISSGIESVLPSLLAKAGLGRAKQNAAVLEMTQIFMLLSWPLAGLVAFAAPPLIQLLWGSKWAPAAAALHVLAFCLPAWILKSVIRSLIEARGLWKQRFIFLGIYGFGGILSAAAGAATGKINIIAGAVTAFYLLFAAGLLMLLPKLTGGSSLSIVRRMLVPCCLCLLSSAIATCAALSLPSRFFALGPWIMAASYIAAVLALNATLLQSEWRASVSMLLRLRST